MSQGQGPHLIYLGVSVYLAECPTDSVNAVSDHGCNENKETR